MPDKKIIDLENLKKFRQLYDKRLKDGTLVPAKSLTSEQLQNVSEDSGSLQSEPFLFQATGTNNNTTETPTAPIAKHLELRGNSKVPNQLFGSSFTDKTVNNVTFTYSNAKLTVSGTANSNGGRNTSITNKINLVEGHKYLFKLVDCGVDWCLTKVADTSVMLVNLTQIYTEYAFYTSTYTGEVIFGANVISGGEYSGSGYLMAIDLTLMFGLGNEPTSALQFIRDYPSPYYSFNGGQLKSCKSQKLITIGYNQFDGEFENGAINDSTGDPSTVPYLYGIRSKNFTKVIQGQTYTVENLNRPFTNGLYAFEYDCNKNFIKRKYITASSTTNYETIVGEYIVPEGVSYIKFGLQNNDTSLVLDPVGATCCFHLTWDESRTGYEDYDKHEYDLPQIELKSAGINYDEVKSSGISTTRIGAISIYEDTQNITITQDASGTVHQRIKVKLLNYLGLQNLVSGNHYCISNKYASASGNDTYNHSADKIINQAYESNGLVLFIYDSATLLMTDEQVADYIRNLGLTIYYSLNENDIVETSISSFAENIVVDDFGTMEFVPTDDNLEPVIPQGNQFFYPADYVLFVDDMYNRSKDGGSDADVNNFVTQSELTSALSEVGGDAENLADAYDPTSTYNTNDLVIEDNVLYKALQNNITGTWDSTKWAATTIKEAFGQLAKDNTWAGANTFNEVDIPISGNTAKFKTGGYNLLLGFGAVESFRFNASGMIWSTQVVSSLGLSSAHWKTAYIDKFNPNTSGYGLALPDTTSWTANKEIATTDYFWQYKNNSTTQLEYSSINNITVGGTSTFTLASAPANTYPEYKANITNSGASTITVTLPSGTSIKGNVTILNNTFEIPAGSSVELSLQNQKAIVISWD